MEKDQTIERVRPASTTSSDGDVEGRFVAKDPKWQPGFRNQFPWLGFSALVMVLVCAAASVIVLVQSDGSAQANWPRWITPNVLINVFNSVENICFTIAIANGVAIAWWRKTLKGSTIADLNRSWVFSMSLKEVVLGCKYFNIIALAALTAKLTIIDSSLMQRATGTTLMMDRPQTVSNVTGFVNQTFPITGTVAGTQEQPGLMMHWMGDTLKMWSKMGGIYPNQWNGCEDLCFLNVDAIGFAFDCEDETEEDVNYGNKLAEAFEKGQSETADLFEILFDTKYLNSSVSATLPISESASGSSYLEMNVTYTNASHTDQDAKLSCPGVKRRRHCKLWPAIVRYPIQIENSTSAFTVSVGGKTPSMNVSAALNGTGEGMNNENLAHFDAAKQQQDGFEVIRRIPIHESHSTKTDNINSTLSGIQLALEMYIRSRSMLSWDNSLNGSFIIDQMGHAAAYMTDPPMDPWSCGFAYSNPCQPYHAPNGLFKLPSIVGKINQIMWGLATDVSEDDRNNDRNETTRFDAVQYQQTIHYITHYAYMWGAIAATIVCVLLVLPAYWGFWQLGRKVTLNPFEIAHAFRSPVVNQASTAQTAELVQEVGDHHIRYGNIVAGAGRGHFGVDDPQNVAEPAGSRATFRESWRPASTPTSPRV